MRSLIDEANAIKGWTQISDDKGSYHAYLFCLIRGCLEWFRPNYIQQSFVQRGSEVTYIYRRM